MGIAHKDEYGLKRCLLNVNGLAGYIIAVLGLLVTLSVLIYFSVIIQKDNAEVYYSVNQDLNALKMNSTNNNSFRIIEK